MLRAITYAVSKTFEVNFVLENERLFHGRYARLTFRYLKKSYETYLSKKKLYSVGYTISLFTLLLNYHAMLLLGCVRLPTKIINIKRNISIALLTGTL